MKKRTETEVKENLNTLKVRSAKERERVARLILDDTASDKARSFGYLIAEKDHVKANRRVIRDPIAFLVAEGHLTKEEQKAAMSMALAHRQIIAGIDIRVSSFEPRIDQTSGNFNEDEAQRTIDLHKTYSRWWDEMKLIRRGWMKRKVVLEIVTMGVPLSQIKRAHNVDHRTAKGWLREALNLFNEIELRIKKGKR